MHTFFRRNQHKFEDSLATDQSTRYSDKEILNFARQPTLEKPNAESLDRADLIQQQEKEYFDDVAADEYSLRCVHCQLNQSKIVFLPCGHFGYCLKCADRWLKLHSEASKINIWSELNCLICGIVVNSTIHVFY